MKNTLTHFELDSSMLAIFRDCIDDYGVADDAGVDDSAEWPNNMMSRKTVVYGSGVIAREGEQIIHNVDPDELALCKGLAAEAKTMIGETAVGMGSESDASFFPFYVTANVDAAVPAAIDENLIRSAFGGTLFPLATITVEPLEEKGTWWSEVLYDAGDEEGEDESEGEYPYAFDDDVPTVEEYLRPWRDLIKWFTDQPEFQATAFVRIGDRRALWDLEETIWPPGTQLTPCALPRLVLGLTKQGSLAGLFGYSVQT